MTGSTLMEVFGHIVFSFTRGVTEHFNPEEPEFTAEYFGYDPLQSTGREWYYLPVDELIYQEYSDREVTNLNYLASSHLNLKVLDACSPEENEETQEDQQDEDRAMAWKRLRPSALRTVCKSMYIGALISLLTATIIGSIYMLISYLSLETVACEFHPKKSIPIQVQWMRTIADVIRTAFLDLTFFICVLFASRSYQLMGIKRKMIFVYCLGYCLQALYLISLQALGISHSKPSNLQKIPIHLISIVSACWQVYLVTDHFRMRRSRRQQVIFFLQTIAPPCSILILSIPVAHIIYPAYTTQSKEGKLLIALFSPLIGVVFKVVSRICVQQLSRNIIHPGYSYVPLAPLYCASAVMFRVLQADLDSLQSIAILGIIHGAAEVAERSTMVVIDHICHQIRKRTSAPWGSFRTPRRERLMADIAIMSMLSESTAIVAVNGFLYLYQFIFLQNDSLFNLLQSFAIITSVQLAIEWFFTSVSLAIETRYQNMAVMAIWRRKWKRHISVAIVITIQVNRKEFDESVVPKEREVERIKVLKSGDVQKTLKSDSSSPSTVDQDLEEDAKKDAIDAIGAHLGNGVSHY
ncbi:hypothetical protein ACROYT_G037791 [Oculina patagonica]